MTAKQFRTPLSVPRLTLARGCEGEAEPLLPLPEPVGTTPHPDFAERIAIWRMQADGLISLAEAQRRSANVGRERAQREARASAPVRPRHTRPEPNASRQYSGAMATTPARDDRLTPNAKAFLQVLRARCGKGRETTITKGTAGNIMSRSTRTIRRYLVDLARFGYVEVEIARNARGFHLGLTVRLTQLVQPFFEEAKGLAHWLAETPTALLRPFVGKVLTSKGVTLLSSKNQVKITSSFMPFGNNDRARKTAPGTLWKSDGAKFVPTS